MKRILLCSAVVFATLGLASANFGGNQPAADKKKEQAAPRKQGAVADNSPEGKLPGKLLQIDVGTRPAKKLWTTQLGDMVQLSVQYRIDSPEAGQFRTIKVEVAGGSVAVVGEVVETPPSFKAGFMDNPRKLRSFSCYLRTVKVGKTVAKVTPVGKDGKDRPAREVPIDVLPSREQEKAVPNPGAGGTSLSGHFLQQDTSRDGTKGPLLVEKGDWIQFHVVCSTKKEEIIRDLKVEIDGDAVEKMAVLTMKVRTELSFDLNAGEDFTKRNIHCLVRAVKYGEAKVSITPVGEDGKERPTRIFTVKVFGSRIQKKGS